MADQPDTSDELTMRQDGNAAPDVVKIVRQRLVAGKPIADAAVYDLVAIIDALRAQSGGNT